MKQLPVSLWKLTPICSYVGNYIGGIYVHVYSLLQLWEDKFYKRTCDVLQDNVCLTCTCILVLHKYTPPTLGRHVLENVTLYKKACVLHVYSM